MKIVFFSVMENKFLNDDSRKDYTSDSFWDDHK